MKVDLFDYALPPELIAQHPTRRRDQSRLMILDRHSGTTSIHPFRDIRNYLTHGSALVVNTTKVFKARLFGHRASGAKVEIFLVRRLQSDRDEKTGEGNAPWEALVGPSRRVKEGERVQFDTMNVLLRRDLGGGRWEVVFDSESQYRRIVDRFGHVPLPHYIRRRDEPADIRRYQTVFADKHKVGAVAAPTAGFHFTPALVQQLKGNGIQIVGVCLHVGPGTFKPVKAENIEDHLVDPEYAELSAASATVLNRARQCGRPLLAVGTTTVRTLESARVVDGRLQPFCGPVDLFIKPGFRFQVVDHLLTNFHLPRSSLLILVSAFAGRERILSAYEEAIRHRMRFYSYGDAMLIL